MNYKKAEVRPRRTLKQWWSDLSPAGIASVIVFCAIGGIAIIVGTIVFFEQVIGTNWGLLPLALWFVAFIWGVAYFMAKDW